ncbi:MAG: hypothetical protein A2381_19060 [Bdellovibrionales bacterium RIFOXYB1_FULL_37_110]|nr:MAG: hypothetical protein A2181_09330 [Bdellovibrionales bacterium RIFOXYA1_FULL_38_20]OFZ49481.1 MAG: hypothetical protein A2417_04210 [Bdellovibrionales bacterium RIFOXYC1_FULL_37_79]OFZ58635.1 MAG: hypothetical protein A2381_19060 [Bdellovibrionales bacterium RIFOXYB1_FULL_37_110]OFZ63376.1 MAG: hypothetical protein A2577_17320 [Bdellovibrionales bacterium RIFOXYD1_FULL_36_51]
MKNVIFFWIISLPLFAQDISLLALFKKVPTSDQIKTIKHGVKASTLERFDDFNNDYFKRLYKITLPEENEAVLNNHQLIQTVEKIYYFDATLSISPGSNETISNDHFSAYQWGLYNSGQVIKRDIDDINQETILGEKGVDVGIESIFEGMDEKIKEDVLVAVVDSGIDFEHPDLASNIYRNKLECDEFLNLRTKPVEDLDGNGYIGDCMGWDFTASKNQHRPTDDKGHGTHVAGIIAAIKNNNLGVSGLSNKIKILPVKVLQKQELSGTQGVSSFTDRVAQGILYSVKMGAKVINLSLGWPKAIDTRYLREAIQAAVDAGVLLVAAAGNNNTNISIFPCSYQNVLCVGALSLDKKLARFSNYGGSVDVIAPGEQILSTFPAKLYPELFSTNGYELKDGTSQAAPFVSAQAAILWGLNPKSSRNEIWARIIETTKPMSGSKYTLDGLIQISQSVKATSVPVIRPIFKDFSGIFYDNKSKTFAFNLPIKNYWMEMQNINVAVQVINPSIKKPVSEFLNITLKNGEVKNLPIKGKLDDLNLDSNVMIKVTIVNQNHQSHYQFETPLVRNISSEDEEIIRARLHTSMPVEKILFKKDDKLYANINTVWDHYKIDHFPSYYYSEVIDGKLTLSMFTKKNEDLVEFKRELPLVTRILNVTRMDLNYDGVLDFFISAIGKNGAEEFLQYLYLDNHLQDLVAGTGFFYRPPVKIFLDTKKSTFIPFTWNNQRIAVPVWVDYGLIPPASKNPDPFASEDKNQRKHIYMLVPSQKNLDDPLSEMHLKILDDYRFNDLLRKEHDLFWSDQISILGSYTQNEAFLKKGEALFQITIGESFLRKYFTLRVSQDLQYQISEVDVKEIALEGSYKIPVNVIGDAQTKYMEHTAFVGFQTDTLAQYAMMNNETLHLDYFFRYEQKIKSDHLLGVMASYIKNDRLFSFMQSKSNIVLVTMLHDQLDVFYHPINRVSFIAGNIFNELYYPVVYGTGAQKLPAYYIDATSLHSGHVYIIKASENGLVAPIKNNVYIPKNCLPMNPVKIENDLEAYSLLCLENGEAVFKYIPIL